MALPFNLVAVFVFLALQPPQSQRLPTLEMEMEADLNTTDLNTTLSWPDVERVPISEMETEADLNRTLSWIDVGKGVIVSMGQVYAVNELEPSLMMNLAVLLSSPVLFVMANIGAALGTLLSLSFIEISEYDEVQLSAHSSL